MSRLETIMSIIGGRGSEFYGMHGNEKQSNCHMHFGLNHDKKQMYGMPFPLLACMPNDAKFLNVFCFLLQFNLLLNKLNMTVSPSRAVAWFDISVTFLKVFDLQLFSRKVGEGIYLYCGEKIKCIFRLENYEKHTFHLQIIDYILTAQRPMNSLVQIRALFFVFKCIFAQKYSHC